MLEVVGAPSMPPPMAELVAVVRVVGWRLRPMKAAEVSRLASSGGEAVRARSPSFAEISCVCAREGYVCNYGMCEAACV